MANLTEKKRLSQAQYLDLVNCELLLRKIDTDFLKLINWDFDGDLVSISNNISIAQGLITNSLQKIRQNGLALIDLTKD